MQDGLHRALPEDGHPPGARGLSTEWRLETSDMTAHTQTRVYYVILY